MKLIVGLGNPGVKYEKTRHNIGFMVVEQLLKDFEPIAKTVWNEESKFKSDVITAEWQPKHGRLEKIIIAKPKTYMNNSGMAVSLLVSYFKVPPSDIWIVHDDLDLPLGAMKIRFGGAFAGHRGVESIIESIKTDKFWRFRLGIGEKATAVNHGHEFKLHKKDVDDFVLGSFRGQEKGKARELIKTGSKAIQAALEKGLDVAMNRFNTK